ncbi:MAG: CdaR family protein [Eubacteriales bacterium]|nr:CdaR family protein [Eubacteriales bacterium]
MNLEPEKNERRAEGSTVKGLFRSLPGRLWRLLSHNWPWKLLALFLALCLWAGLITQDPTLTRERVFSDVSVSVTGSDTLRRSGLIVLSGLDSLTARLRVEVPQREYNTVTSLNYNPRVDLSRVTEAGTQTVKLTTTSSSTYGTVAEMVPDSVELVVDSYVTNYRVPVTVNRTGDYPAGYYGSSTSLDPASVSVSGPESVVDRIARVMVDFDASLLPSQTGLVRTAVPMYFVDLEGNRVQSDLIEVTSAGVLLRSVVVEQTLYPTKALPLNTLALTVGTPAEGYEVKSVTVTPASLIGAGDQTALELLDQLFADQLVDISGADSSVTAQLKIRKPSELAYLSTDSVTVEVEIGLCLSARTFAGIKLQLSDADAGLTASCAQKTVDVTLAGPTLTLEELKASAVAVHVDCTGLPAGEHELPVQVIVNGQDKASIAAETTPKSVFVVITADE